MSQYDQTIGVVRFPDLRTHSARFNSAQVLSGVGFDTRRCFAQSRVVDCANNTPRDSQKQYEGENFDCFHASYVDPIAKLSRTLRQDRSKLVAMYLFCVYK